MLERLINLQQTDGNEFIPELIGDLLKEFGYEPVEQVLMEFDDGEWLEYIDEKWEEIKKYNERVEKDKKKLKEIEDKWEKSIHKRFWEESPEIIEETVEHLKTNHRRTVSMMNPTGLNVETKYRKTSTIFRYAIIDGKKYNVDDFLTKEEFIKCLKRGFSVKVIPV